MTTPIKFAVIEYSSKTGKIWTHTDERPNFLCDPVKEIDATSFGCYVSALEGEHIPLTHLILGKDSKIVKTIKKAYKRIFGSWPTYDISYLKKFDVLMVVHQISDGHEITALTKKIRKKYPHIKIIGVDTQPYGIVKPYWEKHPDWLANFKQYLGYCHVYITVVESTKPAWQELTSTPVEYMPQPYPAEFALEKYLSYKDKKPILLVAGVTDRFNIKKGQSVAKAIQKEMPQYNIHIIDTPGLVQDMTNLAGASYEVIPFQLWRAHLDYLNKVALVINTDYTKTRGRVQVDCAATGTISVGANSDGQVDFYPEYVSDPDISVEEITKKAIELLKNEEKYESIAKKAKERLLFYGYEESRKRLLALASRIKTS